MGGAINSQAAMAQYSNQPAGLPPSTVDYADVNDVGAKKQKKKRKKRKDGTTPGEDDANAVSLTPAAEAYNGA